MRTQQRRSISTRQATLAKLLLLILSVCLTLFALEMFLEIRNGEYTADSGIPGEKRYIFLREHNPNISMLKVTTTEQVSTSDSLTLKEYRFRTDENGFIKPTDVHDDPELEIVFLGGSTTECKYVEEELRFPYLTGKLLGEKTNLKVNSYNSGVSGNNSLHSIDILVNKVLPIAPDIAVMMHAANDMSILLYYENTYWNKNPRKAPIQYKENKRWSLFRVAKAFKDKFFPNLYFQIRDIINFRQILLPERDEFADIRGKQLTIDQERILSQFAMNLQTFINISKARNIEPVLMTQQNRLTASLEGKSTRKLKDKINALGLVYSEYKDLYDSLNQEIRRVAALNDILLVDLDREIPKDMEYIYDLYHFNDAGSQLAAEIISEALRQRLSVSPVGSR